MGSPIILMLDPDFVLHLLGVFRMIIGHLLDIPITVILDLRPPSIFLVPGGTADRSHVAVVIVIIHHHPDGRTIRGTGHVLINFHTLC